MGRHPDSYTERAGKLTYRQAAFFGHVLEWHTAIEVGGENFHGAPRLPRREPTPVRLRWPHATVGLSDVGRYRLHDVINEQPVSLFGPAERGKHRAPKACNGGIVAACAEFVVEVADLGGIGVVSDRV